MAAPVVDQDTLTSSSTSGFAIFGGRILAQEVRAGANGYLTRIDLGLQKTPGLEGEVFFQVVGLDNAGLPNVLDVKAHRNFSLDGVPDEDFFSPPGPAVFDLTDDLIKVQTGDRFAVLVSRFGRGTPPWATARSTGGYTNGDLFLRESGRESPWQTVGGSDNDLQFRTWVDAQPDSAETGTVEVRPVFDASATRTFGQFGWTVEDGTNGVGVQSFGDPERAIMEFALPELPPGAVVTGARLDFDMGGGSGSPIFTAHPYQGNGVLDNTDAFQEFEGGFSTGPIVPVGDLTIELSADRLNQAYDDPSNFLGFLLQETSGSRSGFITSMERNEFSISDGADLPALVIDWEINAAAAGDTNGDGRVDQTDLNAVLTNWGFLVSDRSLGDLSGDFRVEQNDLNLVLNNWGAQAPPDFRGFTVPEPTSATLLLTGFVGFRRCRCSRSSSSAS
ncbi:MAG: hypothetical protein AAGF84_14835 [Planctomycetota bacterium]